MILNIVNAYLDETTMADEALLRGACSCGRNQYNIHTNLTFDSLQVVFGEEADQGRALSLRVPLSQLRSTTFAFYPDETHSTIRRVFTPSNTPYTKRHFCGFCGTQLTFWSEESREEAEFVCVSLWSLKDESLEVLKDAGLLSHGYTSENEGQTGPGTSKPEAIRANSGRELQGMPWFEEMVEGSELGRIKRSRGGRRSFDGRSRVEWEIVEFEGDKEEDKIPNTGKRKLDMIGKGDDVEMRGGL